MSLMGPALSCVLMCAGSPCSVSANREPIPSGQTAGTGEFPVVGGPRRAVIVGQSHFLLRAVVKCAGVKLRGTTP